MANSTGGMSLRITRDIAQKRLYQLERWSLNFDDKNTIADWISYITQYAGGAAFAQSKSQQRKKLLDAATLCVAALEAFDRNEGFPDRHFDEGLRDIEPPVSPDFRRG